jgi:thiamine pyrophosphokinase
VFAEPSEMAEHSEPRPAHRTVVVTAGGGAPSSLPAGLSTPVPYVIAADSGVVTAHRLGLHVDLAVGDFDSVPAAALDAAVAAGAAVERHPVAKDRTDLQLALDAAVAMGARRVIVIGGDGGRFDHVLANALVLAAPAYAGLEIEAHLGAGRVHVVRHRATLRGTPGELLTLLAVHGPAHGVTTEGLLYPLHGETLQPGSTRGVSNRFVAPDAAVSLTAGVLLAVAPGVDDPDPDPGVAGGVPSAAPRSSAGPRPADQAPGPRPARPGTDPSRPDHPEGGRHA